MKGKGRMAGLSRKTRETDIHLKLNLDGTGKCDCELSDEFLTHMIETLAKYSGADIEMTARGDINHHLVEDTAIVLGKAFRTALGDGPVRRIASATVPMDEALVQVSLDIIDRPFAHLELPDVMYEHFIRSFTMELRATVHTVVLRGRDSHHIVEATFKALGLALREAMQPSGAVLSTKSSVNWRTD